MREILLVAKAIDDAKSWVLAQQRLKLSFAGATETAFEFSVADLDLVVPAVNTLNIQVEQRGYELSGNEIELLVQLVLHEFTDVRALAA